ncbi:MAG: hypothetical protein JWO84_30 [Parcubacteria group bacterium]|nr:hypothetical protein [Parcubacteria group bacterium]
MHLNPKKTGLTLGLLFAAVHVIWSLIVAFGWGQAVIDFVMWAHMVHATHIVGPFDLAASLTVITLSFLIGFVVGAVFSKIWNQLNKS